MLERSQREYTVVTPKPEKLKVLRKDVKGRMKRQKAQRLLEVQLTQLAVSKWISCPSLARSSCCFISMQRPSLLLLWLWHSLGYKSQILFRDGEWSILLTCLWKTGKVELENYQEKVAQVAGWGQKWLFNTANPLPNGSWKGPNNTHRQKKGVLVRNRMISKSFLSLWSSTKLGHFSLLKTTVNNWIKRKTKYSILWDTEIFQVNGPRASAPNMTGIYKHN